MNASNLTARALLLESEGLSATEARQESFSRGTTPAARGLAAKVLGALVRRERRAKAMEQERDDRGRFA